MALGIGLRTPKTEEFLGDKIETAHTLPLPTASQSACHNWQLWIWMDRRRLFPHCVPSSVHRELARPLPTITSISKNLLGPVNSSHYHPWATRLVSAIYHPLVAQPPRLNVGHSNAHVLLSLLLSTMTQSLLPVSTKTALAAY